MLNRRHFLKTAFACAGYALPKTLSATWIRPVTSPSESTETDIVLEKEAWFDSSRDRSIPVGIYTDPTWRGKPMRLAIISHGYGGSDTAYLSYSFIAKHLAKQGYYTVSVEHEAPGDDLLPTTGNVYESRLPSWQRGVQNILFVIAELKAKHPNLDYAHILLVGHSHGGDTSMLFAKEHPELVYSVSAIQISAHPFAPVQRSATRSWRNTRARRAEATWNGSCEATRDHPQRSVRRRNSTATS